MAGSGSTFLREGTIGVICRRTIRLVAFDHENSRRTTGHTGRKRTRRGAGGAGAAARSRRFSGGYLPGDEIARLPGRCAGAASGWPRLVPPAFPRTLAQNEPGLSSALAVVAQLIAGVGAKGVPPERVILIGFSQGACLALEFAARHARRYGGVVGLSGGVIGPPGTVRKPSGSLAGTPVYLGCGDRDFHIPVESVNESAVVLGRSGLRCRSEFSREWSTPSMPRKWHRCVSGSTVCRGLNRSMDGLIYLEKSDQHGIEH